jgi:hypothetical protein
LNEYSTAIRGFLCLRLNSIAISLSWHAINKSLVSVCNGLKWMVLQLALSVTVTAGWFKSPPIWGKHLYHWGMMQHQSIMIEKEEHRKCDGMVTSAVERKQMLSEVRDRVLCGETFFCFCTSSRSKFLRSGTFCLYSICPSVRLFPRLLFFFIDVF